MRKELIWRKALTLALWAAAGYLALRLLGPVLLPFAVGGGLARLALPAVRGLHRRSRLPRWLCAGICVTGLYGLLASAVWLLCRVLCRELGSLLRSLPALAQSLTGPMARLEQQLAALAGRFPDGIGKALEQGVAEFFRSGAGLGQKLYDALFSFASAALSRTPDIVLFTLTAVLSSFMLACKLPELGGLWRKKAPAAWQQKARAAADTLKKTLGSWAAAQLKLMGVTFLILTAGLLILGMEYPLLFGLAITVLDALPVLGSGAVLIPWSILQFLRGSTFHGVGLLCLYAAAALTRTALEPRILGRQMGLDPLLTLLSLYAGYRFFGFAGMILFPMGALTAKQLMDRAEKRIDN